MAFKKIPLTIDTMIRNPVPVEGINQEDNIELNIVVTENKTPKDLSSQTIKVYVRRIDGTLVEQTDQITPTNASKGEVTVKLKNSAFNKEGYALFQLDVSDSSGRITSSYATFKIGKGLASGEAIANTNEVNALKQIEEYVKKANKELETFKQTVVEINENEATRQENERIRIKNEKERELVISGITEKIKGKYDNVILQGYELRFYSEGILKKTINIPVGINGEIDLSGYQTKEDETLITHKKDVIGAINELSSEVLLNKENATFNNQEDFIETLKNLYKPLNMNLVVNDVEKNNYSVIFELENNKAIRYLFSQKTMNGILDDYILLGESGYGELIKTDVISKHESYDEVTGEWNKQYPPSFYTTEVGATMTKKFVGNRIDFYSFGDDRGGVWEFVIDDEQKTKFTHSTWREKAGAIPPVTIWKDIKGENKEHTLKAIFKGDDPEHIPSSGVGTSRGWVYYNEGENAINSFYVYKSSKFVQTSITPLYHHSNKEFAIEARKDGTESPFHFCPMHDVLTAKEKSKPKILIDSRERELLNGENITGVNEFKIIQQIYHKNPETEENLAEITTVTTVKKDGTVTINGKYKALIDLEIKTGYGIMFPFDNTFNKKLLTSINNEYITSSELEGTNVYLEKEKDKTISFLSLSDSYKNLALACTFFNPKTTLRQNMQGKQDLNHCTWINYRNSDMAKLYQQVYYGTKMKKGELFRFSGGFLLAECDAIYELF
jgi:hypothetical protein